MRLASDCGITAGYNNKALDKDLKNVEQTSCKSERLDRLKKVIKAMNKDQNGHLCPDELDKGRIRPERHSCSSFFESAVSSCDLDSSRPEKLLWMNFAIKLTKHLLGPMEATRLGLTAASMR
jgi:hypothetical protein